MHPRKIPNDLRDQKAGDKRANPKFAGYDRYVTVTQVLLTNSPPPSQVLGRDGGPVPRGQAVGE